MPRSARCLLALLALGAPGVAVVGCGDASHAPRRPASRVTRSAAHRSSAHRGLPLAGIPPNRWIALPAAPDARTEVAGARIADIAYVVGGFTPDGRTTAQVQTLDLRTGRWGAAASLPLPLNHMNAVGYGGKLYVVGGYASPTDTSTDAVRDFWRYDPKSRRWAAMPSAPVPRAAAGAAVLGHRLYVVGGRNDANAALSSVAIFNFATGRWSMGPSLVHPREHLAAVADGGAVWALGGRVSGVSTTAVERLGERGHAWRGVPGLPVPRSGFEAVAVGGSIFAVGGESGANVVSEVARLDTRTQRWTSAAPLPAARHGLAVIADGPLIFAITGGPQAGLTSSRLVSRLRVR